MIVQEPVQAAIWQALNHYAYSDAIFLSERLYAEVGSDEALFLLATCNFRAGKFMQAYKLLQSKGCPTAPCRYLLAQCCVEIDKLSEAESILAGNLLQKAKSPEDIINEYGDAASFALHLLGKIYGKTERPGKAAESYKRSLKLNSFLWTSFEGLCQLGEKPDPAKVFQVSAMQNLTNVCHPKYPFPQYAGQQAVHQQTAVVDAENTTVTINQSQPLLPLAPQMTVTHTPDLITQSPENVEPMDSTNLTPDQGQLSLIPNVRKPRPKNKLAGSLLGGPASLSPLTPSFGVLPLENTPSPGISTVAAHITPCDMNLGNEPARLQRAPKKKTSNPLTRRQGPPPVPPVFASSVNTVREIQGSGNQTNNCNPTSTVRRSSRLFSNASSSVKENNKNQGKMKFPSLKAPAKKSKTRLSKSQQELNELNKSQCEKPATIPAPPQMINLQRQSADGLMHLLQDIGRAYLALAQYNCHKAIELYNELSPQHYNTGWVMCQVGRAYFELGEHQKAASIFAEVRDIEPYHIEDMETYSTALWHLGKEVQLSALAQDLTDSHRNTPQTWCVSGNCFSLQKEHDTAIKFFKRAIQLDPNFAYAYTLLGHEYVITEEMDKAMACFRNSIRIDSRHYNAWYGVGMIYYRQEKFALAEVHFKKALSIHPESSVLLCHVAAVQHALQKSDSALVTLNKAISTDPRNSLCKFHRASVLLACDKHQEALKELEELKQIAPKESLVYFLIGKVQKKLGNTHLALMNFSWAMDLDPKGANNQIKEAIDKRYVTDEDVAIMDPVTDDAGEVSHGDLLSNNSSLLEADNMQLQAMESDESL